MKTARCDRFRDNWLLDADGELSGRRQRALRQHLAFCASCRAWTDTADHCCGLHRAAAPDQPLSDGTRVAIRIAAKRLRFHSTRRGLRYPFALPAMAAAMLVFAGLAAWQGLRQSAIRIPQVVAMPNQPADPMMFSAAEIRALVYLLESEENGMPVSRVPDAAAPDPLVTWLLAVQADETLEYLDERLVAAF